LKTVIPINVDVNASARDYRQAEADGNVLVYSTFYTYQGEGPFAYKPAQFIRMAGCNIGLKEDCPWCDTAFDLKRGQAKSKQDIAILLSSIYPRAKLVVVTGGEPLLQWHAMTGVIDHVTQLFPDLEWQFETNGLLLRDDMLPYIMSRPVSIVVSPKVPHSWDGYRPLPRVFLQNNPARARKLFLKYVVEANQFSKYHDLPVEAYTAALAGFQVYVSGMTVYKRPPAPREVASVWDETLIDHAATAANYKHAARLALAHGFNVSFQSHLFGAVE
jgi:7-carboxy-7-deazaguanine synthase